MAAAAAVAMGVLQRGLAAPRHVDASAIEPNSAWPTTEAQFLACLDDAEVEFDAWKSNLPDVLDDLRGALEDKSNDVEDVISFLDTIVEALNAKIQTEKFALRKDKRTRSRIVSSSDIPSSADWLLRFHDKFADLTKRWHNERVAFYYALLALRADHDPEARGGRVVDSSEGLERFLTTIHPMRA